MRGTWVCFHKSVCGREETWEPDNVGCGERGVKYHLRNPVLKNMTKETWLDAHRY